MSNMVPSTPSYSNMDYMQNLMRMQQQQQQQPATPGGGHPDNGTRGGQKRHRDNDERRDSGGHGRGGGRGGGRGDRRDGRGGGGGGKGWRGGRGRGRGARGSRGGGRNDSRDGNGRGDAVMANPQYDFETGQIDPAYPANWDADCKLIALMPSHSKPTQPAVEDSAEAEAKRHRADKEELVAAGGGEKGDGGWRDYKPYIVSTFTFDTTSPPLLRDAATLPSRIDVPGMPPVWKQPTLPLHIKVKRERAGGQQVHKPPLSVLMHVANQAGCLVDGQPLPHPTAADGSSLTFVAYRNSLRSLLDARKPTWRIDVQRVKGVVLLRRHLDYAWEEGEDVGHQFERMCTEPNSGADSEKRGWRGLIAGCVGQHMLLTSSEIDAVKRDDSDTSITINASWELRHLVELKTAWKSLAPVKLKDKLKSYWLQSWLGGVPAVQLGLKSNAAGGGADVVIDELRQIDVSTMASDDWKNGCMERLQRMLAWMGEVVQEGVVYKLVRERKDGSGEWQVALYEIVGGKDRWPIWTE